jgi:hypothetical protein
VPEEPRARNRRIGSTRESRGRGRNPKSQRGSPLYFFFDDFFPFFFDVFLDVLRAAFLAAMLSVTPFCTLTPSV